ncbi:NS1 [Protoparvovirus ungulate1]|uniref:Initiator protein NS1 n=1 Tax=Porcine parvovirus TaxID=10796 RepID=E2D6X6_PPV|nr:NS1 [Porcine parvovirus]AEL21968.1 non-structural protein NS1 [Porcine parvovirus]AYV97209.1 NS1 [Protoparvovirus ungulate1]
MAAGNTYSEEVLKATNWLQDNAQKEAFSYVFKTQKVNLNGKEIAWNNYNKDTTDVEMINLQRGAETSWDQATDMEWESEIDSLTKRQVLIFDSLVKKCLFEGILQKNLSPSDCYWFIQHEHGQDTGYHCHVLLGGKGLQQAMGKWFRKQLNNLWSRWLIMQCKVPLTPVERIKLRELAEDGEWVSLLTYTHKQTRKQYTKMTHFGNMIAYYFLNKKRKTTEREHGYYLSSDSGFMTNFLKEGERHLVSHLFTEANKPETVETTVTTAQEAKRGRIQTKKEVSIKCTIRDLVNKRCTSIEDWMMTDPDSYIEMMAQTGGENLIKNTLEITTLTLARTKTAYDLILEKAKPSMLPTFNIGNTRTCKIFSMHNWNYIKVCHAITCVLNRQGGKRNTILFHGPASTGKSIIAQHIANLVGNVGCYNAANVNFPFNDCTNKNLIWIEEAGNFSNQVNQFKAICSGQTIRIDQKGKGSKQIEPTPVIMTTNEDITKVRIGCEERPEHTQPIRDRMLNINLTRKLPGDFGLLEETEWPLICAWLVKKGYQATMASYMHHWGNVPDWSERWEEPKMQTPINTPTDSQISTSVKTSPANNNYAATPIQEDLDLALALEPWSEPTTPTFTNLHLTPTPPDSAVRTPSPTWSEIETDIRACFGENCAPTTNLE